MGIPVLEQAKIQARVLVPLVKALQAELGEERANAIVREALGDMYRKLGEKWWQAQEARNAGDKLASAFEMYAAGNALDYDVIKQSPDAFEVGVTRCRYAQFYKELGVPELGFLVVCSSDFPMAERFGADIKLTRTQTIMQGASHCDFRYTRINPKDGRSTDTA
jgi:L-2-amino-thiazoline-4-carboxylic acid hydrolase